MDYNLGRLHLLSKSSWEIGPEIGREAAVTVGEQRKSCVNEVSILT